MKIRNTLLTLAASATLFAFGSQAASANSLTVPKAYRGTWYQYNSFSKTNYKLVISKDSAKRISKGGTGYIKVQPNYGQQSTYFQFGANNDFTDGLAIGTKKIKVNGHYQKVLATYERMGHYSVFTKKYIHHDYSFNSNKPMEKVFEK